MKTLIGMVLAIGISAPAAADCVLSSLSFNQQITGTISASSCLAADGTYYNVYRFSGQQGQSIRFSLTGVTIPDLRLQLQRMTQSAAPPIVVFSLELPNRGPLTQDQVLPATDDSYLLFVGTVSPGQFGNYILQASAPIVDPLPCRNTSTTLCLNSRFQVSASFVANGAAGIGNAAQVTADTGYFWFFSAGNVEVFVKAVDGRAFNGKYWVFAGGMTNVDTTIVVTDTLTAQTKTYRNPANTPFQPIQDTSAF
jgi:hypothetical protein